VEKIYSKIENLLNIKSSGNGQLLLDLLECVDVGAVSREEWSNLAVPLETIKFTGYLHPKDFLDILSNDQLYEYLCSKDFSTGHFAAALALFAMEKYNLNIKGLPTFDVKSSDDFQNIYNLIIRQLIEHLGVFYGRDLHRRVR